MHCVLTPGIAFTPQNCFQNVMKVNASKEDLSGSESEEEINVLRQQPLLPKEGSNRSKSESSNSEGESEEDSSWVKPVRQLKKPRMSKPMEAEGSFEDVSEEEKQVCT